MNMRQFFENEDRCDEAFVMNAYPLVRGAREIFTCGILLKLRNNYDYSWFKYRYDYNY